MTCQFCGTASNSRWVGGYLCGTINGRQSALCGSLVRYGERIVMVSEIDALKACIARLEDSLTSIREYWNRDNNDRAMEDACWHAINTASEALDTKETKP